MERPNIESMMLSAHKVGVYAGTEWRSTTCNDDVIVERFDQARPGWDSSSLSAAEAAHIANCDPKTIANLCAYIESLEKLCEESYSYVNSSNHKLDDKGLAARLRAVVF